MHSGPKRGWCWPGCPTLFLVSREKATSREQTLTKTLLAKSNPLEFLQAVLLSSAVDDRVLQELAFDAVVVDGGLVADLLRGRLELPRVTLLIVDEARIVVALVEIFEDRREDLGLFIRQGDLLALRVKHLVLHHGLEEWRNTEHVLMCGKDALLLTNN